MKLLSTLLIFTISLTLTAQKKKKKDSEKSEAKWEVANPGKDFNYKTHSFTTDEGTWMNLDVSPDGQTIVFDMVGDIYTLPITGGTAKAIRTGIPFEIQPRFSPDGDRKSTRLHSSYVRTSYAV